MHILLMGCEYPRYANKDTSAGKIPQEACEVLSDMFSVYV